MADVYEISMEMLNKYKGYEKTFNKYGVSISEMARTQKAIEDGKFKIVETSERYEKKGSRWSLVESAKKDVDAYYYLNVVTAIPLFKDKVEMNYTKWGRIPTKLSCVSWGGGDVKAVRTFKFEDVR